MGGGGLKKITLERERKALEKKVSVGAPPPFQYVGGGCKQEVWGRSRGGGGAGPGGCWTLNQAALRTV